MEKSLKGFKQVLMITLLLCEKSRNTGGLDQGVNIEKLVSGIHCLEEVWLYEGKHTKWGQIKGRFYFLPLKWEILKDVDVLVVGSCLGKREILVIAGDQEEDCRSSAFEMLEGTRSGQKWRTCVWEDLKHVSELLTQEE